MNDAYRRRKARSALAPLPSDDPRHGTRNCYTNHRCRCDRCRTAWARYVDARRHARAQVGLAPDDPRHGTQNAYGNYGCRCGPCTAAWSTACVERQQRQRARGRAKT